MDPSDFKIKITLKCWKNRMFQGDRQQIYKNCN
jgi:hypothetical protein